MNQPRLQHRFMSGWRRWLVIAFALGLVIAVALTLALWRQAAVAKECHQETPLPTEVRLIAPGADVPEAVARFAGAWTGAAEPRGLVSLYLRLRGLLRGRGVDPACHTLVVEEVLPNGYARVIFSYGASADLDIPLPDFLRVTGRIVDGALRFQLPLPFSHPQLTYRVAGEPLQGANAGEGPAIRLRLTRVADLRRVGCGPQAGEPP